MTTEHPLGNSSHRLGLYHFALILIVVAVFVWSGIGPRDRLTWYFEAGPAAIGLPLALWLHRRHGITPLLFFLLAVQAVFICVGGKYTYAHVPAGFWLRDFFELSRNPYDRIGHFVQGFVPVLIFREVILRKRLISHAGFLFLALTSFALAFSAFYEFIEWWAALLTGEGAESFLATQGDPWDTQWDMFLAWTGAIVSLLVLSRLHDRQLRRFQSGSVL